MGRWTQYDEDSSRLPEGMARIGYDADTQQYTFKDVDGSLWESAPGCENGRLTRVTPSSTHRLFHDEGQDQAAEGQQRDRLWAMENTIAEQQAIKDDMRYSWRMLGPFLLLVCLVPILLSKITSSSSDAGHTPVKSRDCSATGATPIIVEQGDTCWGLAQEHSLNLDELGKLNPGLKCEALTIGETICVRPRIE